MKVIPLAKQAVQLSKKKRTKYRFQKLKMCKKCNRYSVLKDQNCSKCGSAYVGIDRLVKSIFKNRLFTEAMWILMIVSIGIVAAPTVQTLYYSLVAGLIFCISYVVLTFVFMKSEFFIQLKRLLRADFKKIQAGIQFDSELAKADVKEDRLAPAYEKLREIGDFINSDQLKIRRVMVLNEIILRSDMELELEPLIPSSYDKDFVQYALEVLRINRTLITKKCIAYFIHYRDAIVIDFGMDSLIAVAGTALRMKLYIVEFSGFIEEFLEYFPKERVLRLCNILYSNPDVDWGGLSEKAKQLVAMKYHYDPDFKRFVS
ncbi:hypothetical protein [Neobacillus vireti]|uniref:Uncharacterized protein n=1 Tax=Neobacillus vireti LMG 21834 TaxID=1131730 RepID=A0AB94IRQ9_9BACI|nr:hypothetical protein [Neobacillus vireti]ETI69648.1 hypothetical protein BAVI_06279 [Neobacillus vireti LMG 21834]KLT18239.1 hypothetical protein AA980_07825 [Neobacillus vireti]